MGQIKDSISKIFKKIPLNKYNKYLFIIGIVLIIMVYFWTDINKNKTVSSKTDYEKSNYTEQIETSINKLVKNITGQEAQIMVTLESDGEVVYANQINTTVDTTENTQAEGVKYEKSDDTEQNYIIIEKSDGTQEALVVTKINPTIKGVAIVVKNANEIMIEKITDAVTTALDISSSKVCVISS